MPLHTCTLGRTDYEATQRAMQAFTLARDETTDDQLWLCEHEAVYTQGVAGNSSHILDTHGIPVVQTNRGGQVTYHGPGQAVAYPLMDLRRRGRGYGVKEYVHQLEEAVIRTLAEYGITGHRVAGAPGIYVRLSDPAGHAMLPQRPQYRAASNATPVPDFTDVGKIAALGIKVSRHCTYHGIALNVAMDLTPFADIHPCGYAGLATLDLSSVGVRTTWQDAAGRLASHLRAMLAG
ncbi:MAG: lipoate--protein ligase [Burkholderiales bacterium 66-5]|nr:MAG: lipoate--protein ligase [Burkholderiales bacterium 66-5]